MIYIIIPSNKHEKLIIHVMCKCYCSYKFWITSIFYLC